jgi:putative transposase
MVLTRRRLPHIHESGRPIFLTFRLHDSLPANRTFPNGSLTSGEAFVAMDRLLDESRTGPLYLSDAKIAEVVANAILDSADYELHAWVVMPNHVHLLITPQASLPRIMQLLKGSTAHEANRLLKRTGTFWQDESYDHLVRNGEELRKIERYIVNNPVKAGLVTAPEMYP